MRHYLEVQYSTAGCTLLKGGYALSRAMLGTELDPRVSLQRPTLLQKLCHFAQNTLKQPISLAKRWVKTIPGLMFSIILFESQGRVDKRTKPKDLDKMVWYLLNNYSKILPYINIYKKELLPQNPRNIDKLVMTGFAKWFKSHACF